MKLNDVSRDVERAFNRLISSPTLVLAVVSVVVIHMTHIDDFRTGPLGKWAQAHPESYLIKSVVREFDKLLGAVLMVPVAVEFHMSLVGVLMLAAIILALPPLTLAAYSVLTVVLLLLLTAKHPGTRLMLIIAMVIAIWAGILHTDTERVVPATGTLVCPSDYRKVPQINILDNECSIRCVSGLYFIRMRWAKDVNCWFADATGTNTTGKCNSSGGCTLKKA